MALRINELKDIGFDDLSVLGWRVDDGGLTPAVYTVPKGER